MKPRLFVIREKQFNQVYLPLFLMTEQYTSRGPKRDIPLYLRKVEKLLFKNYQYVYPKTRRLFNRLKLEYKKENPNIMRLITFEQQVLFDYEKLKRELGYPTNSFLDMFKRLNFIDKISILGNLFYAFVFIFTAASVIVSFFNGRFFEGVITIVVLFVLGFVYYICSIMRR